MELRNSQSFMNQGFSERLALKIAEKVEKVVKREKENLFVELLFFVNVYNNLWKKLRCLKVHSSFKKPLMKFIRDYIISSSMLTAPDTPSFKDFDTFFRAYRRPHEFQIPLDGFEEYIPDGNFVLYSNGSNCYTIISCSHLLYFINNL